MSRGVIQRMHRAAVRAVVFVLAAGSWFLVWRVIAPDVLNRIGYWMWLKSSTEGIAFVFRINAVRYFLEIATPLAFGLACAGSRVIHRRIGGFRPRSAVRRAAPFSGTPGKDPAGEDGSR